jgi:hypothetical protein
MTIPIPRNIHEFRVELGKALLVHAFQTTGLELPDYVMDSSPNEYHVEAADRWCADYSGRLRGLAALARRAAMTNDDDMARISIMSDLESNLYGVRDFLHRAESRYVADVFGAGMLQNGEELRNFLQLVQQLAAEA